MGLGDWIRGLFGGQDDASKADLAKVVTPSPRSPAEEFWAEISHSGQASTQSVQAFFDQPEKRAAFDALAEDDPAQAIALLRRLLAHLPKERLILKQLARLYEGRRDLVAAEEIYRQLIELGEAPAECLPRLARLAERQGDKGRAFELYQEALIAHWDAPEVRESCLRLRDELGIAPPLAALEIVAHTPPEPYEIIHPLGRGGFGAVYLAQDKRLQRKVALKFLHEHLRHDQARVDAFFSEAKIIAALASPGVVGLYDIDREAAVLVLEYMSQGTLADRLASGRALNEEAALWLLSQLCETLISIHARGLVHGDIKPANVLFRGDGAPVLSDFGITSFEHEGAQGLATPRYAAPEIVDARQRGPVDRRADFFSLGILLAESLSATKPPAPQERRAWLRQLSQSQSPRVQRLLSKLCAEDPAQRYRDGRALLEALSSQ